MARSTTHYRRPAQKVYETEQDRIKEARIADKIGRHLGLNNRPTKKFSFVDFVLFDHDNNVKAFLEVM